MYKSNEKPLKSRLVSMASGAEYSGLGVSSFRKFANENGALIKIGGRTLVDLNVLNRAIDALHADRKE